MIFRSSFGKIIQYLVKIFNIELPCIYPFHFREYCVNKVSLSLSETFWVATISTAAPRHLLFCLLPLPLLPLLSWVSIRNRAIAPSSLDHPVVLLLGTIWLFWPVGIDIDLGPGKKEWLVPTSRKRNNARSNLIFRVNRPASESWMQLFFFALSFLTLLLYTVDKQTVLHFTSDHKMRDGRAWWQN